VPKDPPAAPPGPQSQPGAATGAAAKLRTDLTTANKTIGALEGELKAANTTIDELRAELAAAYKTISTQDDELATATGRVARGEKREQKLAEQRTHMQQTFKAMKGSVDAFLRELAPPATAAPPSKGKKAERERVWMDADAATEHAMDDLITYMNAVRGLRNTTEWKTTSPSLDDSEKSIAVAINMMLRRLVAVMVTDLASESDLSVLQACFNLNRATVKAMYQSVATGTVNGGTSGDGTASPWAIMQAACVVMRDHMKLRPTDVLAMPFGTLLTALVTVCSVAQIRGMKSVMRDAYPADADTMVTGLDFVTTAMCEQVSSAVCRASAFPDSDMDFDVVDPLVASLTGTAPPPAAADEDADAVPPSPPPGGDVTFDAKKVRGIVESSAAPFAVAMQYMVVAAKTFCETAVQRVVFDAVDRPTDAAEAMLAQMHTLVPTIAAVKSLREALAAATEWKPSEEFPTPPRWTPTVIKQAMRRTRGGGAGESKGNRRDSVCHIEFPAADTSNAMPTFDALRQAAVKEALALRKDMETVRNKAASVLGNFAGSGPPPVVGLTSLGTMAPFDALAQLGVKVRRTLSVDSAAAIERGVTGAMTPMNALVGTPVKKK